MAKFEKHGEASRDNFKASEIKGHLDWNLLEKWVSPEGPEL